MRRGLIFSSIYRLTQLFVVGVVAMIGALPKNTISAQLDKLLRDVSDEQDRIRVLVGRVEIITGVRQSKSLHECLARWQAATRQVHTARTDGKVTLASDLVNLSSNIRRIRQGHNQIVLSILASTLQRIFVQSFCDCWDQDPHLDHRQLRPLQIPLGGQTVSKVH